MAKKQKESFDDVVARLNGKFGSGSLMVGDSQMRDVKTIPHPSLGFNHASSVGGIAEEGKLYLIDGESHSGKSTFTLETMAAFQKAGKRVAYFDYEHSYDKIYARKLGLDTDLMIISQPETLEDGYNLLRELILAEAIDLAVIDSVNAMVSKARLSGEIGDHVIAAEARLHSAALPIIKSEMDKHNVTVIGITQYRSQIGSMSPQADKGVSGGQAWKFYSDVRISLKRFTTKKDTEYFENTVEITKSKIGKPYGKCKMIYSFGEGIDQVRELIEYGKELGLIKQAGAWYSHGETKLGGGINAVKEFFNTNPEYFEQIYKEVEQALRG